MKTATVVGAGVFGAWIAHALQRRGWQVTLVEQYGSGNSRSSSGGETRIIRSGYGQLSLYAQWARQSLPLWMELQRKAVEPLFVRTGAVFLGADDSTWLADTAATLHAAGIPAEWIDEPELTRRFPQLRVPGPGLFEPSAGVLFARRAVQALTRLIVASGVQFQTRHVDGPREITENRSDALIFACGAWLPRLFPDIIGDAILPTRQEVFFFGPPPGDPRYGPASLPVWIAFAAGLYGLPDLEHRGVKVALDRHGPPADPDAMDRRVSEESLRGVRGLVQEMLPGLADAPLLESRVCQYQNTSNGHLLLDRLPGHDRIWLAGGGSGHGFKHGPAVGRYMADLIEGGPSNPVLTLSQRPPRQRLVF